MSETKVKEIKEFVDGFHNKLKESFKLYEYKSKKYLKKNFSEINNEIKIRDKFPTLSVKKEENKFSPKNNYLINNKSTIWKPPNATPRYFEELSYMPNKNELNTWDKVSKYLIS